jgi:hypothetical protein
MPSAIISYALANQFDDEEAGVQAHSLEQELHDDAVEEVQDHTDGFAFETGIHFHDFLYETVHIRCSLRLYYEDSIF